ncbi:MAG: outer membrane lipoprotein carrier protein LolA [Desulfobacteraceae bacterium]|nr:outer membrane lipoprotein carrier protein LolA [Desulfobacteraceae bacterium]
MKLIYPHRLYFLICLTGLFIVYGIVAADAPGLDKQTFDVITKIKKVENSLKSFSANFIQLQKSDLLESVVRSQGTIYYEADGKLLIKVTSPSSYSVLFDGEWVLIHDPEQKQTKKHSISGKENILKKYFGFGQPIEDLIQRFEVKATKNMPLPDVTLVMRPKKRAMAKRVRLISAIVDDQRWLPGQIYVQFNQKEWIRLTLNFKAVNQPLPPDTFILDGSSEKNE